MRKNLLVLCVVVAGILLFGLYKGRNESLLRSQIRDLELRLAHAEEVPDTFFIHDSIPVYQTIVKEVDRTDYKKQLADRELIKELKLRVSELESVNSQLLVTKDTVVLAGDDSLLTYRDRWSRFSYDRTTGVLDWEVRDSLTTFVSCVYKRHFLWFRWKKRGYKVTIVNHNPRSRVEYESFVKIK